MPSHVFEIVLNVASLGILSTWGFIIVCQMAFRRAVSRGEVDDVSFKMPGAPVTSWLTLAFLCWVVVLMALDYPNGTYTVASILCRRAGALGRLELGQQASADGDADDAARRDAGAANVAVTAILPQGAPSNLVAPLDLKGKSH